MIIVMAVSRGGFPWFDNAIFVHHAHLSASDTALTTPNPPLPRTRIYGGPGGRLNVSAVEVQKVRGVAFCQEDAGSRDARLKVRWHYQARGGRVVP
jgi:hypothetical protein